MYLQSCSYLLNSGDNSSINDSVNVIVTTAYILFGQYHYDKYNPLQAFN